MSAFAEERRERRIRLESSLSAVVKSMAEGNPGALSVCAMLLNQVPGIDPDALLGGLGALMSLDQHGIYGPSIWMFYKDVCRQDLAKMLACLRAIQLGRLAGVTPETLAHAIENRGEGIDADAALAAVRERLPRFAAPAAEVAS